MRTEPLKALVIGAFVRGLSMRDVESLCEQAGLGKLSKSQAERALKILGEHQVVFPGGGEEGRMLRRHAPPIAHCVFHVVSGAFRDSSTHRASRALEVRGSRHQHGTADSSLLLFDREFRRVRDAAHFRDLPERHAETDARGRQTCNAQCFA